MTRLIVSLVAATALALGAPQERPDVQRPAVIAIKFHADWCGSCKAMGSVFTDLADKYDTQPVLFVTLDQTTDSDRRQSEYLASALACEDIWREHGGKTGFVLLVDAANRQVLSTLTKDDDIKAMGSALVEAVQQVSATR